MSTTDWKSLRYLTPGDFSHPDQVHPSIVLAVDNLAVKLGTKPQVLSDVRPDERASSQHSPVSGGRAIDTTWPGVDPLRVWDTARAMQQFSGLGVYLNQVGAVSFHMDTRTNRSVSNPATWGTLIKPGKDGHQERTETAANQVLAMIGRHATSLGVLLLFGAALYLLLGRKG